MGWEDPLLTWVKGTQKPRKAEEILLSMVLMAYPILPASNGSPK